MNQNNSPSDSSPKDKKENPLPSQNSNLPPKEKTTKRIEGIVHQQIQEMMAFSGPLPHPEILGHYERILSGSAERILKMAESQEKHRHDMERKIIVSDTRNSTIGLILAFVIAFTAIAGGIILIYSGKELTGFGTFVLAVASIVGIFYRRRMKTKDTIPQDH